MIETAVIHGKQKTLLYISSEKTSIVPKLIQGKLEPGYLYEDGKVSEWYWEGFTQQNGNRYIYFAPLKLTPLKSLFNMDPAEFLNRISDIAELFKIAQCEKFIPEDALFLIEGGGILLLPSSVIGLQTIGKSSEQLEETYEKWVRPGFKGEKAAVYLLTSYLYHFIAKEAPLEAPDAREDSYRPTPVNLFPGNLNPKAGAWMQAVLNAAKTDDIQDLSTWISEFNTLRNDFFIENPINAEIKLTSYIASRTKRAKRKKFLRKRGGMLFGSLIVLAIVGTVLTSLLVNILAPPATIGLPPEEMISLFYQSQNNLDMELMDDCLARGVNSEAENISIYLFVTSRDRMAHETNGGLLPVQQWLDKGKPEVDPSTFIYGVTDLTITRLDDDTFRTKYTLWTPVAAADPADREINAHKIVEQRKVTEELDVRLKKNYWLITEIRKISSVIVD